jgi:hypothetical protein
MKLCLKPIDLPSLLLTSGNRSDDNLPLGGFTLSLEPFSVAFAFFVYFSRYFFHFSTLYMTSSCYRLYSSLSSQSLIYHSILAL